VTNHAESGADGGRLPLWIDGAPVWTADSLPVRDPGLTADIVGYADQADPHHVDLAVRAAERARGVWTRIPLVERCGLLHEAADLLAQDAEELTALLARENGGLLREARMDLQRGAAVMRSILNKAIGYLQPETTDDAVHWLRIEKKAIGVVALIVPWNSPIVLAMSKVAPALVAGNTIVLKPSPLAPLALTTVLMRMADLLPQGVVNVVNGDSEVGASLTAHPLVRKVSFTGSVAVGKEVMRSAAASVKNVSLELGGNDAAVVLEDVNILDAVGALSLGAFTRAGQICFAVKRIYVPSRIYDDFWDAMCSTVDAYQVGHGLDESSTLGPVISQTQVERLTRLVDRTREEGATVRESGTFSSDIAPNQGYYMRPVLVRDIHHSAALVAEEQFGPVIPVIKYDRLDEAVFYANDSEFGLASSVWSSDIDRAVSVAARMEAGSTFINSHNVWSLDFDMPFGGVKQSGIGRERTEVGIQEYVEHHAVRVIKN
jgi:acyl-CoA reductase-like NAD-dependent aldehyde dehydrogenase